MPRAAFGCDADTDAYDALATKVRADEAAKVAAADKAAAERRRSIGLPEDEHKSKSWKESVPFLRKGDEKKTAGEMVAGVLFGDSGRRASAVKREEGEVGK